MKFNIGTIRAIKEWQICVTMIHRTNDPHLLFIFCSSFFFLLIYGIFDKKMSDITYTLITFLSAVLLLSWQQHCHRHLCWYTVSQEMRCQTLNMILNPIMSTGCCDSISGMHFNIFFRLLTENCPRKNSKENLQTWHRTGMTELHFWT